MTAEHKIQMAPVAPDPSSAPAPEGKLPEKTPAQLEIEAWYRRFTSREDVREIMTRLAK